MTVQPWSFGDPKGPGDQFQARENLGNLVAFVQPKREITTTKFGEDEVTRCRYIVVLDGGAPGSVYENPIVFGNLGENAWADGDEAIVLGRVGQSDAKPGQNPAFILNAANEGEKAIARTWFDANARTNAAGNILIG